MFQLKVEKWLVKIKRTLFQTLFLWNYTTSLEYILNETTDGRTERVLKRN